MDITNNYIDVGKGDNLILLHGNGENLEYFKHQIDYFNKSYRIVAIDTRGHGETPKGDKKLSLEQFCDDLYRFMKFKGIEKANILGFSDGGNIAILFAIRHPDMVDRLILNGANIFPGGMKTSVLLSTVWEYIGLCLGSVFSDRIRDKRDIVGLMIHEPKLKFADLHSIKAQTLVIAGKDDMIKESHTKLIAENIENSTLKIIEGDHFIAYRNHVLFNKTVEEFLKG